MDVDKFFFRLYAVDPQGNEEFLGSAFPVAADGGLVTCRHVVDIDRSQFQLTVHDNETGQKVPIREVRLPSIAELDIAFLPGALPGDPRPFLPILPPQHLRIGEDVYSYGFFALAGRRGEIEQGYFSGRIVNFTKTEDPRTIWSLTLPYPVLEGMSGSPVLTYHNGPKVVGLAYGNRSTRILASEILSYQDEREQYRETVHRIVEFGLAYHCNEIGLFLTSEAGAPIILSEARVSMAGL